MGKRYIQELVKRSDKEGINELISSINSLKEKSIIQKIQLGNDTEGVVLYGKHFEEFRVDYCMPNFVAHKVNITLRELSKDPYLPKEKIYIYFLIQQDEVVYIGQTINLFSRVDKHRYDKDFNEYRWSVIDRKYADHFEAYLIRKYVPKYNQVFPIPDNSDRISEKSYILLGWEWE